MIATIIHHLTQLPLFLMVRTLKISLSHFQIYDTIVTINTTVHYISVTYLPYN